MENGITNVVSLIKHHNCLLCEISRDHLGNLWVQHVGIVEDYHVSLLQLRELTCT
jgi:hypothetical protein